MHFLLDKHTSSSNGLFKSSTGDINAIITPAISDNALIYGKNNFGIYFNIHKTINNIIAEINQHLCGFEA